MRAFLNALGAVCAVIILLAPASPAQAQGKKVLTIGFAQDDMSNDWRAAQVREVAAALADRPDVRFIHTDAGGDTAKNVLDIENMVDRGIDLLIVSPRNHAAMTPLLNRLHADGLPIVLLTREIDSENFTTFISPDDADIATQAAETLAAHIGGGQGRILVLQGVPSATTAVKRLDGFTQALKKHPGLSIVRVAPANYKRQDAITAVEQAVEDGVEFDAIYAQSDSMAEGARIALRALGRDPKSVPIVGIDYIADARRAIRAGEQIASFTYPTCGAEGARAALKILAGEAVPKRQTVPSIKITRDNVDRIDTVF